MGMPTIVSMASVTTGSGAEEDSDPAVAHQAAKGGLGDSDMMRIFGWRSRQMLNRYGASAADERARDAYKKLAPGDRL